MLAIAVEVSNLHKRIALIALNIFGASPRRLLLGFMAPTALLSMWMSNMAASAMMVPILGAVLEEIEGNGEDDAFEDKKPGKTLRAMLCMSICTAANIGGTATTIGTGVNLIAIEILTENFGKEIPITFTSWIGYALPQLVILFATFWVYLQFYYLPNPFKKSDEQNKAEAEQRMGNVSVVLKKRLQELGRMNYYERNVLCLFVVVVLLWLFRSPGFIHGWGDAIEDLSGTKVTDSTSAMAINILMFALPADKSFWSFTSGEASRKTILEWKVVQAKLPWGLILLFGGGFALGAASSSSGLSAWIGTQLAALNFLPVWVLVLITTVIASTLTQIASNAATANIILPIMVEVSRKLCVNPILLILPPTFACSFAFILPLSTPPNAIAFASAKTSVFEMMKAGMFMNIVSVVIVMTCIFTYGYFMFDLGTFPEWALAEDTNCTIT